MTPADTLPSDFEVLGELRATRLPASEEPLQFRNLLTGSQYLPIYQLTRRYVRPGLNALDWGSGNGHFAYFLLRSGLSVTAFNLASQECALAPVLAARFGDRYRLEVGPADEPARLPFPDAAFDLVCSIGVLEHVRETGGTEHASLVELRRVLRPGGRFVCGMLPRRHSWIEFLVRNLFPSKHFHRFRYTPGEVERMFADAGFRLLELRTHGFLPRNSLNNSLFRAVHNREPVARAFNALDQGLARTLAPIAQNMVLCAERTP